MNIPHDNGCRFTGWHMLAIMFGFFGVIIIVNFSMAIFASKSWTGLVVKNSYVASQQLNEELEAAKLQKKAGWLTKISFSEGMLSVDVYGREGTVIDLDNAKLFVGRPAFEHEDRELPLARIAHGRYRVDIKLAPGDWAIRLEGRIEGQPYRRDARLFVGSDVQGTAR